MHFGAGAALALDFYCKKCMQCPSPAFPLQKDHGFLGIFSNLGGLAVVLENVPKITKIGNFGKIVKSKKKVKALLTDYHTNHHQYQQQFKAGN